MKSSGVIALVAAGVVVGGGVATYELTKPSSEPLQVNYVEPATTTQPTTATITVTPTPTATTTTASKTVTAVTSSSTTHKATVRKEATVSQPTTTDSGPGRVVTDPPAPDDPIRNTPPPPVPGNKGTGTPTR